MNINYLPSLIVIGIAVIVMQVVHANCFDQIISRLDKIITLLKERDQ